jgi:hypothetical protein
MKTETRYTLTFDVSDNDLAMQITNNSNGFPIHHIKLLSQTPHEATEEVYIYKWNKR